MQKLQHVKGEYFDNVAQAVVVGVPPHWRFYALVSSPASGAIWIERGFYL